MNHRLFIAINIPDRIKAEINSRILKFNNLPFRFVKDGNWHITILFLGYVKDSEIPFISGALENIAKEQMPFILKFKRIIYGSDARRPRMIWAVAEKNFDFDNLKNNIYRELSGKINIQTEHRSSDIHITLARKDNVNFYGDLPEIKEDINLDFKARDLRLMESHLKKRGSEYYLLGEYKFTPLEVS